MMDGKSLPITEDKQNALRQLFPEVFSEGKIDWEKLKATLGEDITFSNERYVLNWAGKSDAFKVLQAPTTKTLIPAKDESINFDETENIFIEGENLEVLKVLQKSYFGKVKMIYIDPPYNTGNDSFIYPDKFAETKEEYQKRVGDKDEDGYMTKDGMFKKNSKENGQYHSNWLNMMYPRLFLAKNLLKDDGIIFVSIDDNEVHNLRLLLNEIFGEENFLAQITIITGANQAGEGVKFQKNTEYCIVYSKNPDTNCITRVDKVNESYRNLNDAPTPLETRDEMGYTIYYNKETKDLIPLKDYNKDKISTNDLEQVYKDDVDLIEKGYVPIRPGIRNKKLHRWRWGMDTFIARKHEIVVFENDNEFKVAFKQEGMNPPKNYLNFGGGASELKELFDDEQFFDYPKSYKYIQYLISLGSSNSDLILDFFSGSGTTAQAVMEMNKEDGGNRKCICIQLPELCDEKSEAYKAGYKTIADIAKERIRRVIGKINEEKEALGKETANLMEKVAELQQQIEELKKNQPASIFNDGKQSPEIEKLIKQQETARDKANENIEKMDKIDQCDKGFKVLKLEDSNFKQWLQINSKDAKALEEQMKLFIDPVAENATIENMVYELLLKSGKDLNCKIEHATNYFKINENELVFMLEKATQEIIDAVLKEKPLKVVALDKLFKGNDQLKTNTVLQMKDAGVEFKTI
ncbi:MAG: site-specific DNA-methyltransferase [Bacteroidales bacterium]|nr:site-specific DNA-methyltransferase [Bacteroidales bacterium]